MFTHIKLSCWRDPQLNVVKTYVQFEPTYANLAY